MRGPDLAGSGFEDPYSCLHAFTCTSLLSLCDGNERIRARGHSRRKQMLSDLQSWATLTHAFTVKLTPLLSAHNAAPLCLTIYLIDV